MNLWFDFFTSNRWQMLYISLSLSLALLVIVNLLVARTKYPAPLAILVCLVIAVAPFFYFLSFPAVAWQAKAMVFLLVALLIPKWGRRIYLPCSFIASFLAYGILYKMMLEYRDQLEQLKQEYPSENLVIRLPQRSLPSEASKTNQQRMKEFELIVDSAANDYDSYKRVNALTIIHENSVNGFVKNAGFGIGRMSPNPPSAWQVSGFRFLEKPRPTVQQPDYSNPFTHQTISLKTLLPSWDSTKMLRLHDDGVLDFINPLGFGYVKDREHVAGFQKHGMTKVPAAETQWSVAHLELVGLVVHEKPMVYMTANLPQMEEAQNAPKRPLDTFELEGLKALQEGEDLYYRGSEDKARMLGSIRAVEQCLKCHGGTRGDLLGAFSYGLRRE